MDSLLIHLLNVKEISKNYDYLFNCVSKNRQEKVLAFKMKNDQLLSLGSGYFIKKYIGEEVLFNQYGKPYVKDKFFNISHDKDYVVFIEAKVECGIDIEFVKKENQDFLNYPFNYLIKDSNDFYYHWTMLEAITKASGIGLAKDNLKEIPSQEGKCKYQSKNYYLKSINYDNYFIGIALETNDNYSVSLEQEHIK